MYGSFTDFNSVVSFFSKFGSIDTTILEFISPKSEEISNESSNSVVNLKPVLPKKHFSITVESKPPSLQSFADFIIFFSIRDMFVSCNFFSFSKLIEGIPLIDL